MSEKKKPFNESFAGLHALKQQMAETEKATAAAAEAKKKVLPPTPKKAPAAQDDDAAAFARAMNGVRRIGDDGRGERVRKEEPRPLPRPEDDTEALIDLASSLDVDLRLEGAEPGRLVYSRGLDPRVLRQFERGAIVVDDTIDLHGKRKAEALIALEIFLKRKRAQKTRCVCVVTGRGLHSDAGPVLRDAVREALAKTFVKHVLACCVAQPPHGGEGALYVLLRRR